MSVAFHTTECEQFVEFLIVVMVLEYFVVVVAVVVNLYKGMNE